MRVYPAPPPRKSATKVDLRDFASLVFKDQYGREIWTDALQAAIDSLPKISDSPLIRNGIVQIPYGKHRFAIDKQGNDKTVVVPEGVVIEGWSTVSNNSSTVRENGSILIPLNKTGAALKFQGRFLKGGGHGLRHIKFTSATSGQGQLADCVVLDDVFAMWIEGVTFEHMDVANCLRMVSSTGNSCNWITIDKCFIKIVGDPGTLHSYGRGIYMEACSDSVVSNTTVESCGLNGVSIGGGMNKIDGCFIDLNLNGLYIAGSNNMIEGTSSNLNFRSGIVLAPGATGNTLRGGKACDNNSSRGVSTTGGFNIEIAGNGVYDVQISDYTIGAIGSGIGQGSTVYSNGGILLNGTDITGTITDIAWQGEQGQYGAVYDPNSLLGAKVRTGGPLTPQDYGARGDNVTMDTVALKAFWRSVVKNKLHGYIPPGKYRIDDEIPIDSSPEWRVEGANANSTTIIQTADNKPILHFLATPSYLHSVQVTGITFDYANNQPSNSTNAYPIKQDTMMYQSKFDDLVFKRGTYGIYVTDGTENPWGNTFDNLRFEAGMTVGAMRMSTRNGVPNNHFGRIECVCTNMIGPVFNIKGYNTVIDTIEFLEAHQGAQLMYIQAGAIIDIGALKLENGTYTHASGNKYLFEVSTGSKLRIGQVSLSGNNLNITPSGKQYIFTSTGGNPRASITVGHVAASSQLANVSNAFVFGSVGFGSVNTIDLLNGWAAFDNNSTDGNEFMTIHAHRNGQLSGDKGDADLSVVLGERTHIMYETALTAPRTVTLPSDGNNLFNGLTYRIQTGAGVATGTNTLTIKSGSRTIATLTAGKTAIQLTWRRNATPANGWVVTDYSTLP